MRRKTASTILHPPNFPCDTVTFMHASPAILRPVQSKMDAQPAPAAADAKLLLLQQELTDYFTFWRAANTRKWRQAEREAVYKKVPHPRGKPSKWPGPNFTKQNERRLSRYNNENRVFPALSRQGMQAEAALRAYNPLFKTARVHKRKLLGFGGLGVAGLFSVEYENGSRQDVVIKLNLKEVPVNHLKYEISNHIVGRGFQPATVASTDQRLTL